jgi:hypothetical protein
LSAYFGLGIAADLLEFTLSRPRDGKRRCPAVCQADFGDSNIGSFYRATPKPFSLAVA